MLKRGQVLKSWRRRYFELFDSEIVYWNEADKAEKKVPPPASVIAPHRG
jgi:hypothetical protein